MADDATTTTQTATTDAATTQQGTATTATATQTAAAQALSGTGTDKAATAPDFMSTLAENTRDYVANKGWKSAADILTSYQTLEAKFGSDKVVLPKEGDAESLKAFRAKMGVPESADKYDIKLPEGSDVSKEFLGAAKNWFHEHNVSAKDAQGLVEKYNAFISEQLKGMAGSKLKASEDGMNELMKEWGNNADANKAAAQRAFKTFSKEAGLEATDLDSIEEAIGTQKMMKLFASIGSGLAEARFVSGSMSSAEGFTPEAARAEIARLKTDREWFAKFQANDGAAVAHWQALQKAAAAGLAA